MNIEKLEGTHCEGIYVPPSEALADYANPVPSEEIYSPTLVLMKDSIILCRHHKYRWSFNHRHV